MVETKALNNINDSDVQAKKIAAERYCKYASEFTAENGGKAWKYLLLPHDQVSRTSSFEYLRSMGK
jgi:type III restriction enzyme